MFSDKELLIIWFALTREQYAHEEGSHRWWKYERMIKRIEEKVGATKRPHLTVINTNTDE
jgi:hypothetical protein